MVLFSKIAHLIYVSPVDSVRRRQGNSCHLSNYAWTVSRCSWENWRRLHRHENEENVLVTSALRRIFRNFAYPQNDLFLLLPISANPPSLYWGRHRFIPLTAPHFHFWFLTFCPLFLCGIPGLWWRSNLHFDRGVGLFSSFFWALFIQLEPLLRSSCLLPDVDPLIRHLYLQLPETASAVPRQPCLHTGKREQQRGSVYQIND